MGVARDVKSRAKDGYHTCQKCGCWLPQKVGRAGRLRKYCDQCNSRHRSEKPADCRVCGKPVPRGAGTGRGRRRVTCSQECRRTLDLKQKSPKRIKKCVKCSGLFWGYSKKQFCSEQCRWPRRLCDTVKCNVCGVGFVRSHNTQRCCSDKCRKEAISRNIASNAVKSKARAKTLQCLCCGRPFRKKATGRNAGKYCSRECAFEARRLRLPCATVNNRAGSPLYGQLAAWFHSWDSDTEPVQNVGHRRGGHKWRCIKYGCEHQKFSLKSIFNRDGWVCQICREPLLPKWTKVGESESPHPRSPTIDHIVPLSFGPTSPGHVPSNVQACCWECNSRKGNRPNSFAVAQATRLD